MDRSKEGQPLNNPSDMAGPHRDRQGVDQDPDAESRQGPIENFVADTQTGKTQNDGDPSEEQ